MRGALAALGLSGALAGVACGFSWPSDPYGEPPCLVGEAPGGPPCPGDGGCCGPDRVCCEVWVSDERGECPSGNYERRCVFKKLCDVPARAAPICTAPQDAAPADAADSDRAVGAADAPQESIGDALGADDAARGDGRE